MNLPQINHAAKKRLIDLRRDIVMMAEHSGHVGVALSCVDIIAALYGGVMNCTVETINDPNRDRFILSKGHGCMALYAVLADAGFMDRSILKTYGQNDSILAEHPVAGEVPGIEFATGTLGHGLAIGVGMAHALKLQGSKSRVFVLLGDGECGEGSIWEAAALASTAGLDNLTAIVDMNNLQACGKCDDISPNVNLIGCWQNFGWEVSEVDGHDYQELVKVLSQTNDSGRPVVFICHTVKGKGIDFMERDLEWHYRPVKGNDSLEALQRLDHA